MTRKEQIKELYDYASQNAAALAQNEIALNRQVFENDMALLRQRYDAEQTYLQKVAALKGAGLPAGGRDIFAQLNAVQRDAARLRSAEAPG